MYFLGCLVSNLQKEVKGVNEVTVKKKETTAEKKMPEKAAVEDKDKELSVSLLRIQVGLIRKAWKHPSADRCDINTCFSSTVYKLIHQQGAFEI